MTATGESNNHSTTAQKPPKSPAEWDELYDSTTELFSGQPNSALLTETGGLRPGRALDVGCGEGADAVWLARRGWQVTGLDVSRVALDRAAERAAQADVQVHWIHAGLAEAPFPPASFDLVSAHYPALPSSPDRRSERALLDAVAPGGHLLVVYHAGFGSDEAKARGIDPADYVWPTDIVAALLRGNWAISIDTSRPRESPKGGAGQAHTHDVILRAQRGS